MVRERLRILQERNTMSAIRSLLLAAILLAGCRQGFGAEKPNVVFFLVDDMGWTDLACYGSELYETPNIDRLAKQGIRFTSAYAACPVCAPTRHSILSGKYPARSGCTNYTHNMRPDEVTLPETLKEAGYSTYFLGKWHLGHRDAMLPTGQGFDVNIGGGANGQPASYFWPYGNKKGGGGRNRVKGLDKGGKEGEYLTDRLGDEAVKLLDRHDKAEPFLLYFAFYSVHTPIQGRPDLVKRFKTKVEKMKFEGERMKREGGRKMKQYQDSPEYAAMVHAVDLNVGKVLAALERLGLDQNTIVFFTSDNGGASYYGNATCNLPLRAAKGWVYEGGVRVPMIARWPGRFAPGECDQPMISTDFYPTILELLDLPAKPEQHADGVSIAPLLTGKGEIPDRKLYWHYPHNHGSGSKAAAGIHSGKYKLIEFLAGDKPSELYDVEDDIGEKNNLFSSNPELAARLQAELDTWQKKVDAKQLKGRKQK